MRSVTREDAPQALPRVVATMKKCEATAFTAEDAEDAEEPW